MNIRAIAADVLRDKGFVDDALDKVRGSLEPRDRALLTEIVYGVTRRRLTLDFILDKLTPGKKIHPMVRNHLRIALYQIRHMRVPDHAAVNEAVEAVKIVSSRSSKFVNAVLRRAIAEPPKFPKQPPARRISVEHSHPEWLAAKWIKAFGEDVAEDICRAGNATLPVTARIRGSEEVIVVKGNPADHPKPIQVQDRTQMRAAEILDPEPGEKILDLCAAPGGKAIHILDLMEGKGEVVAVDISADRLGLLTEPGIRCVVMDGREFSETGFDGVLVDAPCSNTGVLSRRPDARWRVRPEDLVKLPPLQRALLDSARRAVKPGGRIVYSTCSLETEENDAVLQSFCRETAGAELQSVELIRPSDQVGGGFFARIDGFRS